MIFVVGVALSVQSPSLVLAELPVRRIGRETVSSIAGEDEDDIGLTNNGHPLRGHTVTVNAKIVEMEGPPGKLTCNFKHLVLDFQLIEGGKKLKIDAWFGSRKTMAAIRTSISHIQDLITGVTKELPIKDAFGLCPLSYKRLHQPN